MSHTQSQQHGQHNPVTTHVAVAGAEAMTPVQHPDVKVPLHIMREFKFSFKKQTIEDDLGNEIKRPPVVVSVPIPTFDGLIKSMENEKVLNFILDLTEEAIKDQIRSQLSDADKPAMRQEDLDMSKLTLEYIATMPKSERTGGGISKETWEEWEKDYIATMVPLRASDPKAAEKVGKAAKLLVQRLNPCRTDKPVLKFLREQLALWATTSPNAEEFGDVYQYLDERASLLINRENTSQLESL